MALIDILRDREKMAKLVWLGFISSLAFIAIGLYVIMKDLLA
ncbi:MAG: PLDc N-terminal domain-containing protein [Candidatus Thermoplasmatota archaeon]|nr:PLDc N-terminal domain-containing protein [Candidatus Thermoplasmatota archaeon]